MKARADPRRPAAAAPHRGGGGGPVLTMGGLSPPATPQPRQRKDIRGFASALRSAYLRPMPILPRPVSPTSAFADLKMMFAADRPHRWGLLGLSMAMTSIMLWGFYLDSRSPPKEREIYYVESWMSDRRDSDIIIRQKADLANYEKALDAKQKEFQHVADLAGIEWREDAARNKTEREAIVAAMQKHLDQKLSEALAREAKEGKAPKPEGAQPVAP
jgi:hypothetical protein